MQTTTCSSTIRLSRPLYERVLASLTDAARELRAAWRRHAAARRHERELQAVAEMNELLLRDIGAPDWMIAEAAARRDVDQLRLSEMRNEHAIGRMRGLQ